MVSRQRDLSLRTQVAAAALVDDRFNIQTSDTAGVFSRPVAAVV